MIDARVRGHSTVPVILKAILATDALALRDLRDNGGIAPAELERAVVALQARVKALLARRGHTEENRRLLKLSEGLGSLGQPLYRRTVDP